MKVKRRMIIENLDEKSEYVLRKCSIPTIKGKITKFKLWWRGIEDIILDNNHNPIGLFINRKGIILYESRKTIQKVLSALISIYRT